MNERGHGEFVMIPNRGKAQSITSPNPFRDLPHNADSFSRLVCLLPSTIQPGAWLIQGDCDLRCILSTSGICTYMGFGWTDDGPKCYGFTSCSQESLLNWAEGVVPSDLVPKSLWDLYEAQCANVAVSGKLKSFVSQFTQRSPDLATTCKQSLEMLDGIVEGLREMGEENAEEHEFFASLIDAATAPIRTALENADASHV